MIDGITPNINLNTRIDSSKISTLNGSVRMDNIEQPQAGNFKSIMNNMVERLNTDLNAPDQLVNDAMLGTADIHDVMAAISKAEIQLNIATTATTKVIQAYDKIMNISI